VLILSAGVFLCLEVCFNDRESGRNKAIKTGGYDFSVDCYNRQSAEFEPRFVMRFSVRSELAIVLSMALVWFVFPAQAEERESTALEIFGWVERVELLDGDLSVKAKLDTGAATSSLDATNIRRFRRGGDRWVRFTVTDPDTDEQLELEKPLSRNVRIVRHSGEHQRRAVVTIPLCFGPFAREVEFTLIDRSNFIYPVLLGRSALKGHALIDSGETFINYPDCFSDESEP
jgi:hypothetical protein